MAMGGADVGGSPAIRARAGRNQFLPKASKAVEAAEDTAVVDWSVTKPHKTNLSQQEDN